MSDTPAGSTHPSRLRRWQATLVREIDSLTAPVVRNVSDRRYLWTAVFLGLLVFTVAARLRLHNDAPSGDEPAYLILSQTMQKYHSINILLDHQNQDYWSFYPGLLDAHVVITPDGKFFPMHSPGGPLLWLIPFMIWGRAGALGFMVVVSLLVVGNTYQFLRERRIEAGYAFLTTLLLVVGSPIYMYAAMNFIEPIAALIVIYALRVLLAHRPHPVRILVAGLGLGYAPWVHPRLLTFTVVLGGLLAARIWLDRGAPRIKSLACLVAPIVVGWGLLEVQSVMVWHSLNPAASMSTYGNGPFQVPFVNGAAGLMFDRQFGIISNFPLFLLVLPGILLTLRRPYWLLHSVLFLVVAPYAVLIATFGQWFAGFSPPARFLDVLVPIFAYPIAMTLQRLRAWWLSIGAIVLGLAAYALSLTSDIVPIERFQLTGQPNRPMERIGKLIDYPFAHYAPSLFQSGQAHKFWVWTLGTLAVGVVLALYGRWFPKRPELAAVEAPRPAEQTGLGLVARLSRQRTPLRHAADTLVPADQPAAGDVESPGRPALAEPAATP